MSGRPLRRAERAVSDPADIDAILAAADLLLGRYLMLQKGRKSYALLVAEG